MTYGGYVDGYVTALAPPPLPPPAPGPGGATTLITTARLVDDGGSGAQIVDFAIQGIILNSLDIGWPEVRATTSSRPAADGTLDTTQYTAARSLVATITLPEDGYYAVEDTLRQVMHPANRYYLYVQRNSWPTERRILVSGRTFTPTMGWPKTVQLGWAAPTGTLEGPPAQVVLKPTFGGSEGGIATPVATPVAFATGFLPGAVKLPNDSTAVSPIMIDFYGPCTGPSLVLQSTGEVIAFNITLLAGNFLHVDMQARTVNLNGIPSVSRYNSLDFARSAWWTLPPGDQQVLYNPSSAGAASAAVITWRPHYI